MEVFVLVGELVSSLLEGLVILIIFSLLTYNKTYIIDNKLKSTLFILLYTLFSATTVLSLHILLHIIVLLLFTVFILAFFTSTNLSTSLLITIISTIYFFATEGFILIIVAMILKTDIKTLIKEPTLYLILKFISIISQIILLKVLCKLKFPVIKKFSYDYENYSIYYNSIGVFLIAICIGIIIYIPQNASNLFLYKILLFLIFIIYLFVGIVDLKEKNKLVKDSNKLKLEKEYVSNLENTINIIRREKHDFANHINTIYAMCVLNKPNTIERIKNYLENISNNLKASYSFFETGNDYIDGLLAVKSNFTFENDIVLDVDFEDPLSCLDIEDNDLVRIISNIVDNAFEAVLSKKNKEYNVVSISSYIEDDKYYISISNNGPQIPPELIDRIFDNGFSTKSMRKEKNHGYGLFTVKRLVNKYNGKINVYSTSEETEFLITFPIGKQKKAKKISG